MGVHDRGISDIVHRTGEAVRAMIDKVKSNYNEGGHRQRMIEDRLAKERSVLRVDRDPTPWERSVYEDLCEAGRTQMQIGIVMNLNNDAQKEIQKTTGFGVPVKPKKRK